MQVCYAEEFFQTYDKPAGVARAREVAAWIMTQPTSGLAFVEIGFNALHEDLIGKIVNAQAAIKDKQLRISLKCKKFEYLQLK